MDLASIVISVLALGVLVIIHEAGHYLVALWGGMKVSRFSVGFGPALLTSQRGETVFQVGAIPLGGYVQIDGMHPEDGTDPDDPRSFVNRPRHLRAAAILAGPVANYLLAFLMLFALFAIAPPAPPVEIGGVLEDSAAAEAGLEVGDRIVGADGERFESERDFHRAIRKSSETGAPMALMVVREGETRVVQLVPRDGLIGIRYALAGSGPPGEVWGAVSRAGSAIVGWTTGVIGALASLLTASGTATVSGPIGIVKDLSTQMQASGWGALWLIAHLSVMLGFFNLLPIPALDGARLVFLAVGAVRRREVEPRLEAVVHGVGFLMLLGLMLVVSWFDLVG